MPILACDQKTRALASSAAAEFTHQRQEKIAELREETADQELAIEGYEHAAKFYERHAVTDPVATLWANCKHTIEVKSAIRTRRT
jgi:hypothetical protein